MRRWVCVCVHTRNVWAVTDFLLLFMARISAYEVIIANEEYTKSLRDLYKDKKRPAGRKVDTLQTSCELPFPPFTYENRYLQQPGVRTSVQ